MAKSTSSLASSISSTSSSSSSSSRCSSDKALSLKSSSSIDRRKRLAANARERKRMHLLNKAYDQLRHRLANAQNKSKYDVLVQAKEYIHALASICEKFDQENPRQIEAASTTTIPATIPMLSPIPQPPTTSTILVHSQVEGQIQSSPMDMSYHSSDECFDAIQNRVVYSPCCNQKRQHLNFT